MTHATQTSSAPHTKRRAAARITAGYVLRSVQLAARRFDHDLLMTVIAEAIIAANLAHLRAGSPASMLYESHPPPDSERRPVSVMAIANSLRLPTETTRRYVNRLIALGHCERVKGGVIVPSRSLTGAGHEALLDENIANLGRFIRELRAAGVTFD